MPNRPHVARPSSSNGSVDEDAIEAPTPINGATDDATEPWDQIDTPLPAESIAGPEFLDAAELKSLQRMLTETAPAMAVRNFVMQGIIEAHHIGPQDGINEQTGEIRRGPMPGFLPVS